MNLMKILGLQAEQAKDCGTLEKVLSDLLPEEEESKVKLVTGLSGLLGKVAIADDEISAEELTQIKEVLKDSTQLPESIIQPVVALVESCTKDLSGIEDHLYSRLVFESMPDKQDRMKVLEALFRVCAVDEEITFEEDKTIGSIATALKLTRQDFITSRLPYSKHLSVIKSLSAD